MKLEHSLPSMVPRNILLGAQLISTSVERLSQSELCSTAPESGFEITQTWNLAMLNRTHKVCWYDFP